MIFRINRRDRELLTAILVIGAIVLGFGGAEVALRWKQITQFGFSQSVEKSKKYYVDADSGLRLPVPNSHHGNINFNRLGFRGVELDTPKPANRIRFLFLGASTTFDPYVENHEDTWAAVAISRLQRKFPGCHFDYANAGVAGMSTPNLVRYYQKIYKQVRPDVVMILTNDMNIRLDALAKKKGLIGDTHYAPSWLAQHSLFWSKIEKNARVVSLQRASDRTAGKLTEFPTGITAGFVDELRNLAEQVSGTAAQPVLLTSSRQYRPGQSSKELRQTMVTALFYMPYMTARGVLEMAARYDDAVRRVAHITNTPLIDIGDIVPGTAQYFADSNHFLPAGARKAGMAVGEILSADPVIRTRIGRAGNGCDSAAG